MCCCNKPNINGTPNGYSWDGKTSSTYRPNPPTLAEGDTLLHDEPGRCYKGCDSHSYHLILVKQQYGGNALLVRHGSGDERISLGHSSDFAKLVEPMDTESRYKFLIRLYHFYSDTRRTAIEQTSMKWQKAAAEKRIKTKKNRGRDSVKVWIEPARITS